MGDYDRMYQTICRLCLTQNHGEKMVSLFENSADDGLSCFGKSITTITSILLQKDDKLPNMMCEKCAYLLKHAVYFKLKCETTNAKLRSLVKSDANIKEYDRSIKEKVCNYVMYSQYFPLDANQTPSTSENYDLNDSNHHNSSEQVEIEITRINTSPSDTAYNFEDFLSNDDNVEDLDNNPEENSADNNILDTIQDMLNTDCKTVPYRTGRVSRKKYSGHLADNNILDTIQDILNIDCKTIPYKTRQVSRKKYSGSSPASKNERNLICDICNKRLANRLTYAHHVQRHNRCRYICDQCGKGFPVQTEMHMHQVARHGIGPGLKCDHCPYKAPRKLDLVEHIRLHTGERPFTCEKCGLTFRRKAIYKKHLVCHLEKTVPCMHCPKKFYLKEHMLAHCNSVHERLHMYMCNICSITYAKTETVRRHMVAKHGIPRERQGKILRINHKGSSSFDK